MIKKMSLHLAEVIERQLPNNKTDIEVYAYGLEIFLGTFIKLTLLVILGMLMDILQPAILVLLAFAGFRVPGGGVHLSAYFRCLITSLVIILALAKLAATIHLNTQLLLLALVLAAFLAVIAIIRWVPAGTEKKRVTDPLEVKGQKLKTAAFLLLWLIACSLFILYRENTYALALVLGAAGGLFLITPLGYKIIHNLDNTINDIERRCILNE